MDCPGETSMRNASAFGSLAEHSGVLVLILVFGLMVMITSQFQTAHVFGGSTTETQEIAVQSFPKQSASGRNPAIGKFHRQWPMTRAAYVFAKLLLVRRENADAPPSARDADIPLLRARRGLDRRVREQNIIHGLALRTIGRDGVTR